MNLRLGATTPTRDFTFVTDTAAGMIRGAEIDEAVGKTINLGTGNEISIGDLATLIAKQMNIDLEFQRDPNRLRPGDSEVERLLSNNGLAQSVLKWKPEVEFDEGIKRTIAWFSENPSSSRIDEYIRYPRV